MNADKPPLKVMPHAPDGKHPLDWIIAGFLFFTLVATGFAAWYTKKQWETTEDTEKRSLRAYVSLRDIRLEQRNDGEWFDVIPEWENTGSTQTVNMKATINHFEANYNIPKEIAFGDFEGLNLAPIILGPKSLTGISFLPIARQCLEQFNRRDELKQFRIWGRAIYNDVFSDERHITNFCWNVDQVVFSSDGKSARMSYTMCEVGNCADNDCPIPEKVGVVMQASMCKAKTKP